MSGLDEMPSLQCPICGDDVNYKTLYWSVFIGNKDSGNWSRLHLDSKGRPTHFEEKFIAGRRRVKLITRIKCYPEICERNVFTLYYRHDIKANEPFFERVQSAILRYYD